MEGPYIDRIIQIAVAVKRFKMFPYFDIAHYILMCLAVRDSCQSQPQQTKQPQPNSTSSAETPAFSRVHPLCSWFGSLMMCFAGSLLGNFFLGEPILSPMQNTRDVMIASIVWYLINYSPFDFVFKLCNFGPIKVLIWLLKEIRRANRVHHGIQFAMKTFPGSYILTAMFGILKGTASSHMRVFQRLACGMWQPSSIELLKPSVVTKASTIAAIIFIVNRSGVLDLPDIFVYLFVVAFFIFLRILWFLSIDPFLPFENLFCSVFMGGMTDALKRAMEKHRLEQEMKAELDKKARNGRRTKED